MIPARKGGLAETMVSGYVSFKFRRFFRGLWMRGRLPTDAASTLVYANHTNFWDGFVVHQLGRLAGWDAYCLMEEQNLARYRFLRRIGAFSIRRGDGTSALETLRYTKSLLQRPRAGVFVFPEGKIGPFVPRALALEGGVAVLARTSRARCVPIAIRYTFFEHERPDVLVEVGEAHGAAPLAEFQARLQGTVASLAAATSLEGFERKIVGAQSVAERWDAMRRPFSGGAA